MNEYTYADWKPNIQERPVMTRYEADQAILIDLAQTFVETRKRYGCIPAEYSAFGHRGVFISYHILRYNRYVSMPNARDSLEDACRSPLAHFITRAIYFKRLLTKDAIKLFPPMESRGQYSGVPDRIHGSTERWTKTTPESRISYMARELIIKAWLLYAANI